MCSQNLGFRQKFLDSQKHTISLTLHPDSITGLGPDYLSVYQVYPGSSVIIRSPVEMMPFISQVNITGVARCRPLTCVKNKRQYTYVCVTVKVCQFTEVTVNIAQE